MVGGLRGKARDSLPHSAGYLRARCGWDGRLARLVGGVRGLGLREGEPSGANVRARGHVTAQESDQRWCWGCQGGRKGVIGWLGGVVTSRWDALVRRAEPGRVFFPSTCEPPSLSAVSADPGRCD
jgi:hypothetical protein